MSESEIKIEKDGGSGKKEARTEESAEWKKAARCKMVRPSVKH